MHRLTREQKIENYEQLLESKSAKYSRLEKEIKNIKLKIEKLKSSKDKVNSSSRIDTSPFRTSNYFQ